MTTTTDERPTNRQVSVEIPKHRTPPGKRVLHLIIDQGTFDLIHLCALRSRMKFTAYMQRFLREAFPYEVPEAPATAGSLANDRAEAPLGSDPTGRPSPAS